MLLSFPIWSGDSEFWSCYPIFKILPIFFRNLQIIVHLRHAPEVKMTITSEIIEINPSENFFKESDFFLRKNLLR